MRISLLLIMLLPAIAIAYGGECNGPGACTDDDVIVGGSTVLSRVDGDESTALAFAHALGDVDINDCLASTQWGSILLSRQKVVLNLWCAAETYDAKAMHHMAALMRCDMKEISRHFTTDIDCIRANTFTPPPPDVTGEADAVDFPAMVFSEVEEDHDESIRELEARLEKIEQARNKPAPAPVQNAIGISEQQRQQLAEVFKQ